MHSPGQCCRALLNELSPITFLPRRGAPAPQHPGPAESPAVVRNFKPPPHRALVKHPRPVRSRRCRPRGVGGGAGAVRPGRALSAVTPCHLHAHPCDESCRVRRGQWLPQFRERHRQGARPAAEAERCRHSRVPPRAAPPLYGHRRDPRRWRINTGTAAAVAPWGTWRRWCWITAPTTPRSATATRTSGERTGQDGTRRGGRWASPHGFSSAAAPAPIGRSPARGPAVRMRSPRRGAACPHLAPAAAAGPAPAARTVPVCVTPCPCVSRFAPLCPPPVSHRAPPRPGREQSP